MRRPDTTTVPEGEPTVRLGPGRPHGRVVLDRYRLDQRLGAGGFGVVWRAHDLKLERDVAVKAVPRSGSDAERSRTEREALAAARLNHPGIVALYEFGYDDEQIYLVSELVEGATLGDLTAEGAVSDRDVAKIGLALCEALSHAHARGIIHRDVKPANVMVLAEPAAGSGFAKLTDLGIAHVASADDLTATGDVVGTLAYMAPEQAEGRRVTPACDVYSLALTLYEAWTGTNPVRAQGPAATARRVGLALPPLRSLRRDLPPALAEVVDAALDPDPAYRPDPAELREVLAEVADDLSDEGGLVQPETLERFGLTAVRARTRLMTFMHRGASAAAPAPVALLAPRRGGRSAARLGAGAGAALLTLIALADLGPQPTFSPLAAAALVGAAVVLLPRLGWLAAAAGICLWLATQGDQPGAALVLAAGLAVVPVLLPRAGTLWSLPAMAPLLGIVGLAPMFVGLASLATTTARRAGLAAAGFVWLAVAEVLSGRQLLFGTADGTLVRARWEGSGVHALSDALAPLVSTPALAPAPVFAAFAVVLPLVVRGRWAGMDLLAAGLWAVGLVVALGALGDLLAATTELDRARGAVAGAALGGLVAVTATLLSPPPPRDVTPDPALP
jgi:eukaryotic-like serine/threonine-protein kinase